MKENEKKVNKNDEGLEQELAELTRDLQRVQADFMNYRRRVDEERKALTEAAKATTIMKLLPVIDDVERAITHVPSELLEHTWAQGVVSLGKRLDKAIQELGLARIDAAPGSLFDPNVHEAVIMEDGEGDEEVVSEELRAGYQLGPQVVRPSMVKVRRQPTSSEHHPDHVIETQGEDESVNPEKVED